jgi:hypothetical protein
MRGWGWRPLLPTTATIRALPGLVADVPEEPALRGAGADDADVRHADPVAHAADRCFDGRAVRHVGDRDVGLRAFRLQLIAQRGQRFFTACHQHGAGALGGQYPRRRRAHALAGAGDERDLA